MRRAVSFLSGSLVLATTLVVSACGGKNGSGDPATADWVAFLSDRDGAGIIELFARDLVSGEMRKLSGPQIPSADVYDMAWSPDRTKILFVADRDGDDFFEVYVVDLTVPGALPENVSGSGPDPLPGPVYAAKNTVISPKWSPDGTKIAFFSRILPDFRFALFCTDLSGPTPVTKRLSPGLNPAGSVQTFAWSPAGDRVAYIGDVLTDDQLELFTVLPNGLGGAQVSDPALGVTQDDVQFFVWAPNGSRIAFLHDPLGDGSKSLWTALPNGAGLLERSDLPAANRTVMVFSWSPDSSTLAYVADQMQDEVKEAFLVGAASGAPTLVEDLTGDLDVFTVPLWSPDGGRLAFPVIDDAANTGDVRVHDVAGGTTEVVAGPYGADNFPSFGLQWSPDGEYLAFPVVFNTPYHIDLHVAAADGTVDLTVGPAATDQFVGDAKWSPDGERLAFRLYHGNMGYDLYTVHRLGGTVWPLSAVPPVVNQMSEVGEYEWTADGERIVFTAGTIGAPVVPAPKRLWVAFPSNPGLGSFDVTDDPSGLAQVFEAIPW